MDFDDIVIGSGLAALGVVLGLAPTRRVLVLAGPRAGRAQYYDATQSVLCSRVGLGGLGSYWHGVIPTGSVMAAHQNEFAAVFRRFYAHTDVTARLGEPWLFVPWRPIRPIREWRRLHRERGGKLSLALDLASHVIVEDRGVTVVGQNVRYRAARVWLCAGALHTPFLLDRALGATVSRPTVSDHVICYLGQVEYSPDVAPRVERTRDGVWFSARYAASGRSLCTLRPAQFAFKTLDAGIEKRAIFGLPTGSIIARLLRAASPGLFAEALYNRTGVTVGARVLSAYAQIPVPDAHWLTEGETPLQMRSDSIQAEITAARASPPWPNLRPSARPRMFIPAIHLHHSVDLPKLTAAGVNLPMASVQVADASVYSGVDPSHHSFRVLVAAARRARELS